MFSHKKYIFAYITYVTKYTNLKKEKMKKKSIKGLAAATAVIMCLAITSCEIYSAVKAATTFYQCEVHKKDGSIVSGRIGGLRSSNFYANTKTVSIKTATSREKISANDVQYLVLWDKDYPTVKNTLMYVEFEKEGRKGKKCYNKRWMYVEGAGDNLIILGSGSYYQITPKGDLIISYVNTDGIQYYLLRNANMPMYFANSNRTKKSMRKMWAEKLKDDPSLVNKITNKEIDVWDFKTIADEYNPK